jgi:hypothetical protein
VGPRPGLDDVKKRKFLTPPGLELLPLGRPARSQSLYRLRYPGCVEVLEENEFPRLSHRTLHPYLQKNADAFTRR